MDHFNSLHIRNLAVPDLAARLKPFFQEAGYPVDDQKKLEAIATVFQVRLDSLAEAPQKAGYFLLDSIHPEPGSLIGKKMTAGDSLVMAKEILNLVKSLPDFSDSTANQPLRDLASLLGLKVGNVFGFLRNALTAEKVTPPVFDIMTIIGRQVVLERIGNAIQILEGMDPAKTC